MIVWGSCTGTARSANTTEPIPNRIVVLTFDDSVKSHFTVVRPILKRYGFGATFFVCEGWDFADNKRDYMTWKEIAQLDQDGFEIGNHTRDHMAVTAANVPKLADQLKAINTRCAEHGIARPTTFAFPGNVFDVKALPILQEAGIRYARRGTEPELPYDAGSGIGYEPGLDHPLLIPTAGDARPKWTLADFQRSVERGQAGKIAVLQFHGVPDLAHPWVHTSPELFEQCMQYLAENDYTVIAMRDLDRYVPEGSVPDDAMLAIQDRQTQLAAKRPLTNARTPRTEEDLRYWLENMFVYHRFTAAEMVAATGLAEKDILSAIARFDLTLEARNETPRNETSEHQLTLLPYPGGRHPRIGFLEGEIRPQRETKFSVFTPWNPQDYVVLDIPEAIWMNTPHGRQLLYLAHTHIATFWDKEGTQLPQLEWNRHADGRLQIQRTFPNGVKLEAQVEPQGTSIRMDLVLTNGSSETLTDLRVQNCVMLKQATGFNQLATENKVFRDCYAACRNEEGSRWIITAWKPCHRPWGNGRCPCLHSDPQFPDCEPGSTVRVIGWLSFYEGTDIDAEFKRIDATRWFE